MYAETNKQLTCGEFCYLPATLCPFPEKVASQNSAQRKDNKVGNKTSCKKGQKKEKRRMRGKNIEKKTNFVSKDKNLINFIQLAEKFALSVKNLFFSLSHSQKLLQKGGSGKECCFLVTKMVVLKS